MKAPPIPYLFAALLAGPVSAAALEIASGDLTELSLEALLDIEVTSVSKQPEGLADAAAAVYVLTGAEIERSGARSIPEALRLVPGLHVAQVDGHRWAITARGFNGEVADKLEVLIDGRSVYSPLFSGVFWDAQDIFLPDLDRIEIIRGPASALWGSNAVNGVINIVTKAAADTQGTLAYAGGGNQRPGFAGARHGGTIGQQAHWNTYAKYWERDGLRTAAGEDTRDSIENAQTGLRIDWERDAHQRYELLANAYTTTFEDFDPNLNPEGQDAEQDGANLLARWQRIRGDDSTLSLQFFWDHTERTQIGTFGEKRDTLDLELKHRFRWRERHSLVWGIGYRISRDEQDNPPLIVFTPDSRTVRSLNFFINDQYRLSDRTELTLSARFEDNEFTGFDAQPSLRFSHQLSDRTTLWGAASRALRLPNRLDHDVLVPIPVQGVIGNPDFEPEELEATELGLRHALSRTFSIEASVYYNHYQHLRGVEPAEPPAFPLIVNNHSAITSGLDIQGHWRATEQLDVHAAYSYFDIDLKPDRGTSDVTTEGAENEAPRHQAWLRLDWQPHHKLNLGAHIRHVGSINAFDLKAHTEVGLRVGWAFNPELELAISGQNLEESQHRQWESDVETRRSVYAELIWRPGARQ